MNDRARNMFTWHPFMKMGNNADSTNPRFIRPPDNRDSMIAFLTTRYSTAPRQMDWGRDPDVDTTAAHKDKRSLTYWPLPENLSYANDTLLQGGINGYPLGDLNWFPDKLVSWQAQRIAEQQQILDILTDVNLNASAVPSRYELGPNYPNPFNPSTTITYTLGNTGPIRLVVYNVLGQIVRVLRDGVVAVGKHAVEWDGRDGKGGTVGSGVYFYQLRGGPGFMDTKKMMLLR
jgi:hypothetical protein